MKVITEENDSLKSKISELQDELKNKNEELKTVKKDLGSIDTLKTDVDRLNSERETVR
jgi:uncharacterized protein YoxC